MNRNICKTGQLNSGITKTEINDLLEIAKQAAEKGGASLMQNYGKIKNIIRWIIFPNLKQLKHTIYQS